MQKQLHTQNLTRLWVNLKRYINNSKIAVLHTARGQAVGRGGGPGVWGGGGVGGGGGSGVWNSEKVDLLHISRDYT